MTTRPHLAPWDYNSLLTLLTSTQTTQTTGKITPIRGVKQGTIPGPASDFVSLITPSTSGPEEYSSLKLPPKIQSLPEEDRQTFMKLINNVRLMKLLKEIPPT